ncbi:MAG: LysR family transcriptional regulator [Erythrobacter sp.]
MRTLELFVAVADHGSFTAAARAMRASPPAVTRAVAELEARLGVMLLHRSTRAVSLTTEGAGFLEQARRILADLADAERQLAGMRVEPSGQLHVTAPVMFGQIHVAPVVAELIDRYPSLDVRLLLFDRNVRLVEEGIDVAVRIGLLTDSALLAARIGTVRPAIVASPAYLARFGVPTGPADLASHRLIVSSGPRSTDEWRFDGRPAPAPRQRLTVNTVAAAIVAAETGVGLANLLHYQIEEALAAGRLIEVLRPAASKALPVSLLFASGRSNSPATRAFIDAMRDRARQCSWGLQGEPVPAD